MPRIEPPPADMETKSPALAVATNVRAAPRRTREIHTAVLGPIGVVHGSDLIERGVFTKALTRRTPKVVIGSDWNRPVGQVIGAAELPPGDHRLPARTTDGTPWRGGGLMLRVELMPGTTEDSRLAVKALRTNGTAQRWSFGFKVNKASDTGGIRRITDLDLYSLSPHVDEPERKAATRPAGLEIKTAGFATSTPTDVRRRWALNCGACGQPVALATAPLPPGASLICRACRVAAGALVDPFADGAGVLTAAEMAEVDRLTTEEMYELAQADEMEWDTGSDGTLVSERREDDTLRP